MCFILTIHHYVLAVFLRKHTTPNIQKILFIKLVEQGATVLAYTAMQEAINSYGRQNVFFCVFEENRAILDVMDMIPSKNIFVVRHSNIFIFCRDILKLIWFTRRIGIDATIDMEFFSRASAILSYLVGARCRVGLHRFSCEAPYRGDLTTHRMQYNPYIHTAKTYLLLVKCLEMDPQDLPLPKYPSGDLSLSAPSFVPHEYEKNKLVSRLKNEGIMLLQGPVILLNPNASDMLPLRKWPQKYFIQLARMILDAYPASILIITGTASERESGCSICREIASSRVFNLAGGTTMRELLTLYTMADILVTNDSGPGHFASLTDIHNIVLFGPETPQLFGAIGGNYHFISAYLSCSPCVNVYNHRFSPCKHNRCMNAITVDTVMNVIKKCIDYRP